MDEDLSVVPAIEDNDLTGTQSTSTQTTDEASEAGADYTSVQSKEADEQSATLFRVPSKRRSASPIPVDGTDLEPASGAALYGSPQSSQQSSRSPRRMSTRASTARQRASINQPRTLLFKEVLYFHKSWASPVSIEKQFVKLPTISPQPSPANPLRSPSAKRRRSENVSDSTIQNTPESSGQEVTDTSILPKPKSLSQVWENTSGTAKTKGKSKPSRKFRHPLGPKGDGWPMGKAQNEGKSGEAMPVEIFEMIAQWLARDDVQNMRLVCREFERKISCYAFRSVVVPFRPKIYEDFNNLTAEPPMSFREQTAVGDNAIDPERPSFKDTYNPKESHVKDGMRVFDQWGPEIKKFALTFEVDEASLVDLPTKKHANIKKTFWGSYEWPHAHYNRFAQAEKYEKKADEINQMSAAFSKLTGLRELGLSVISGQGWLAGPDVSDRINLLGRQPEVFGSHYLIPDKLMRERLTGWDKILQQETRKVKEMFYTDKVQRSFFAATRKRSSMNPKIEFVHKAPAKDAIQPPIMFKGGNSEQRLQRENIRELMRHRAIGYRIGTSDKSTASRIEPSDLRIIPNKLTAEQEEWLIEMEWAQTAFLSSWLLSVMDNRSTFASLKIFNVANLSSKYLSCLHRLDIWKSLPSLENLTILISPDWRWVELDYNDEAVSQCIRPSCAHSEFYALLSFLFGDSSTHTNIKTLKVGFVGGGEYAPGMYARNKNILPAPIITLDPITKYGPKLCEIVALTKIQHLTLKNCWIMPHAIRRLFSTLKEHDAAMQTVTFDSVSLTADTDYNPAELWALQQSMERAGFGRSERLNDWLQNDPIHGSWADIINRITPGPGIKHARCLHFHETPGDEPPAQPASRDPNRTPSPSSTPHAFAPYNPLLYANNHFPYLEPDSPRDHYSHPHRPFHPSASTDDDHPKATLRTITFLSCGYVRLTSFPIDDGWWQSPVPENITSPPECLRARYEQLGRWMLDGSGDMLLGTSAPCMRDEEEGCLKGAWGMGVGAEDGAECGIGGGKGGWGGEGEEKWVTREDGQAEGGSGRFWGVVRKEG
ncbi:MAG: hypothetical protein Q9202_000382 [Teloschistes flavicans]